MSVQRGFGLNGKSSYENIAQPKFVNLQFKVAAADAAGLGITSLKSNGYVENVFMHTSQTPGTNNGHLNPNPASGYALIQFKSNFVKYISHVVSIQSPTTGSAVTSTVSGTPYSIGVLGTTTLAQWNAAGLPAGLTPAVGQAFVAIATGAIGGTGSVLAAGVSGISDVEIIGDPNQSIYNLNVGANSGAYVLVQFLGATSSSVTTQIPTAPANNSVICMSFKFDGSTVSIPDAAGQTGL